MIAALRQMVDRFTEVLDCIDATFIEPGLLDALPQPSQVGRARVGGVDVKGAHARGRRKRACIVATAARLQRV
jgi:hypothetical protein